MLVLAEMFLRNRVVLMLSLSADLQLGSLGETLRFCKHKMRSVPKVEVTFVLVELVFRCCLRIWKETHKLEL